MPTLANDSVSGGLDLSGISLDEGEVVRAVFRHDLNELLTFSPGIVVLTSTHLRFGRPGEALRAIRLRSDMRLERTEHNGVCAFMLTMGDKPVAKFCFTLREQASATEFREAFDAEVHRAVRSTGEPAANATRSVNGGHERSREASHEESSTRRA